MPNTINLVPDNNTSTVIIERGPNVIVENNNITVTKPKPYSTVTVIPGGTNVISLGIQGPQGPPGPSGPPAAALTAPAGVNLTNLGTVVVLTVDGTLIPADPTNSAHAILLLGMNISTGDMGDTIQYLTVGEITGMTGLTTGSIYWAGAAGSLTTSSPIDSAAWSRVLGNAASETAFILDKQDVILIS
jgi:hypothetical protein